MTTHRLFVLDGGGALVSALLLGVVLPLHADWFGAAPWALRVLAAYALVLVVVDGIGVFGRVVDTTRALRVIACGNVGYLLFTGAVLASDGVPLSAWGALYLAGEAAIVGALVVFQLRAAHGESPPVAANHGGVQR